LTKFPVNFPVSREFGSGDGFVRDCIHHHKFNNLEPASLSHAGQVSSG
jgi:hypothetical protein